MHVVVLDSAAFRLDHEAYAYAGKFVVPGGKAVALPDDTAAAFPDPREGDAEEVLGAIAFSEDRTDDSTVWLRYVTVRRDRRGEGIGTRLASETTARLHDRGYETVRIAVNNPYSYEALSKAGFGFTGRETGLAELVMDHPSDRERYDEGLALFADRDLSDEELTFTREKRERGPPAVGGPHHG
ncbi:GNAT family N-acetyltransferase [Halomarina oriensis]|uniref:GNAT family N-acetyltransferase n=1 Tax=Halomarina oriensis TaxID=671145 RepID=A0A6B0GIA0_9EURY|nr:GNAT family N-acetyltransferase [Halomarina oriensis]MWG33531.1 GNAT family N-acetyltransferase [Halomarina oriensis]